MPTETKKPNLEFVFIDDRHEKFFFLPSNAPHLDALESVTRSAMLATTFGHFPGVAGLLLEQPDDYKRLGEVAAKVAGMPAFLGLYALDTGTVQIAILPMNDLGPAEKVTTLLQDAFPGRRVFTFMVTATRT